MKKLGKKLAIGVGLGAAAATAGYYFFGTKNAAKNRAEAAAWAVALKDDVVKRAKRLKKLDEKIIKNIVNETSAVYAQLKKARKNELATAAGELSANWKAIRREALAAGKTVAKTAKKVAKKVAPANTKK